MRNNVADGVSTLWDLGAGFPCSCMRSDNDSTISGDAEATSGGGVPRSGVGVVGSCICVSGKRIIASHTVAYHAPHKSSWHQISRPTVGEALRVSCSS